MNTSTLPISEILTHLMASERIRPAELARRTKLPQQTVQRIVSGNTPNPHASSLQAIAEYFHVTVEQLRGIEPLSLLQLKSKETIEGSKIPLLDWGQVDAWKQKNIPDVDQIFTDAKVSAEAYALRQQDSSMEPYFPKGTILIIDPEKAPKDRSFVVVILHDYKEAIFRQLMVDGPNRYLKALNPDYSNVKIISLHKDDVISGVLVQSRHDHED